MLEKIVFSVIGKVVSNIVTPHVIRLLRLPSPRNEQPPNLDLGPEAPLREPDQIEAVRAQNREQLGGTCVSTLRLRVLVFFRLHGGLSAAESVGP